MPKQPSGTLQAFNADLLMIASACALTNLCPKIFIVLDVNYVL